MRIRADGHPSRRHDPTQRKQYLRPSFAGLCANTRDGWPIMRCGRRLAYIGRALHATWRRNVRAYADHRTHSLHFSASALRAPRNPKPKTQMKRNYADYSYFRPLMLWSDLATKTLDMML